jgi:tRNA (adenine57-N1/adenine58-N1)-methyltransferase
LIVSLLDLHPTVPDSNHPTRNRLEIFEAGTGHGALTLNLARAIHGANTTAPELPAEDASAEISPDILEAKREAYNEWRANRGAVINTLDCSTKHSAHAETVARNFRRGMYYPHIDFHVGSIDDYLSSRLAETGGSPFLDHAILDLPGTQRYLDIVAKSLKQNGTLITFCPSVTQINTGVTYARQKLLPLFLEKTVEVGGAVGVGGREWDIRPVKPRALLKTLVRDVNHTEDVEAVEDLMEGANGNIGLHPAESPVETASGSDDNGWEMVCRPKVGLKISGGGFVGVWRKMA